MEAKLLDRRRKVTYDDRKEIHRRYHNRKVSGETMESIAKDYHIHRQVASRIAREFVEVQPDTPAANENAPES